jgi:3-hydroxybutyrate dehydrogenase
VTANYGLQGRSVVVTGAATGIGRGLATAFAAQGATLALLDRDAARLASVASELTALTRVHHFAADLNDDTDAGRVADAVAGAVGQISVLVNNAGTEYPTPLDDRSPDAMRRWSWLIDNNLGSMVRITRALLPHMADGSSIVNQASIWGHTAVAGFSAYVASKHAVIGLTRSLAMELAPRNIRVNAVCPGWVRTEASMRSLAAMASAAGRSEADMLAEILSAQAVPELLEPADIAGIYLFLASADARAITGQSIVASHGELMH